jgi:hypothetical protein
VFRTLDCMLACKRLVRFIYVSLGYVYVVLCCMYETHLHGMCIVLNMYVLCMMLSMVIEVCICC